MLSPCYAAAAAKLFSLACPRAASVSERNVGLDYNADRAAGVAKEIKTGAVNINSFFFRRSRGSIFLSL
jgi:hypothetical protein